MDAQQFLAEFGHIASAPGGIARLRDMILDLAIRGELISTSKNASDANILLSDIQQFRAELIQSGKFRRPTPLPDIELSELSFHLPEKWAFERLGNVCDIVRGVTFPSSNKQLFRSSGSVVCLRTTNVQANIDWNDLIFIDQKFVSRNDQWIEKGDTMISMANSYDLVGKVALVREVKERATFGGFIAAVRPHILEPEYLYLVLRSPYMQARMRSTASQTTNIANISLGGMRPIPMPIPPKEEQSRIVAKVDELMALCDKLEAQQKERRKIEVAARKAVLGDLTNVDTVSFSLAWERLERNIESLFGTPEAIDDFEASLKDLAVSGLLTPTTDITPDVAAIIQSCTGLRNKYIAAQWMRKQKMILTAISTVDYPSNWGIAPFDEVAVVIGGVTKGRDLRGREVVTCPYLSVANVQRGFFKLEGIKTIEIPAEEIGKYRVDDGDLMITEGGDWDKVGRTAIWRGGIENCLHQNHVFKARVPSDNLLNEWVELVFNSNVGRGYFAGASKQTTNLASINMTQLRSFPLPIPPLVEQKAILEKLSAMAAICNKWREQRKKAQKLSALFAEASVSAITGVHIDEEEELNAHTKVDRTLFS